MVDKNEDGQMHRTFNNQSFKHTIEMIALIAFGTFAFITMVVINGIIVLKLI